jgi:signal transduction histidine kinase
MRLPLRSELSGSVIALMGAGTVILLLIVGASVWLAAGTARLSDEITRIRQTRTAASQTLETLLNAETAQRGYLLTLSDRYLGPYRQARATLDANLAALDRLEAGNPALRRPLAQLHDVARRMMEEMERTIALMDEARAILARMISDAEITVAGDIRQLNANAVLLQWITVGGGALVIGFGIAAMWIVALSVGDAVAARRQVEEANAGLEDRVQRRTAALRRANEEIQRFAYIVSHDLRAPLVNIMGFTTELENDAGALKRFFEQESPEARHAARQAALSGVPEAVKFIRSSTGKMDRLINAILKLSREGKRELLPEPVDLNAVFDTIAASLKHQIAQTQTRVELPARLPVLTNDRLAVEQIFSNLFDNALKYLMPGRPGHITVTAQTNRNSVVISVKDNGRGIAENDLERVFELFRRAGKQDKAGEGIGLAHVRALVRRLGGDITVQSTLGEGSQFLVVLPRSLSADTGHQAA